MNAKEYYEQQRLAGLTDNITCNPNPRYAEPFYADIFAYAEDYHSHKLSEVKELIQEKIKEVESAHVINTVLSELLKEL